MLACEDTSQHDEFSSTMTFHHKDQSNASQQLTPQGCEKSYASFTYNSYSLQASQHKILVEFQIRHLAHDRGNKRTHMLKFK